MKKPKSVDLPPEPYSFIKSIAEQGYSLSTALADLIDNSVSAKATRVEILTDVSTEPFKVFIADNGLGMSEEDLHKNMRFPSNNPDNLRAGQDLGRFGLGMKTASFSQTRNFTVISKPKGSTNYSARTWDVDHLRQTGNWSIIINSENEINNYLQEYSLLSKDYIEYCSDFLPNTIILWRGLHKVERLKNDTKFRKEALADELHDETADHLGMVFHRFIDNDKNKLTIRVNNTLITPFSPFPEQEPDLLVLSESFKKHEGDQIRLKGYVLPARSMKESREGNSVWTTGKRSLTDMEGIFVYRNDRLIIAGGWNRLMKKSPQYQLGRLRVDIGNKLDALFQLNVSKSSLKIPFELKKEFLRAISQVKEASSKEYRNRINNELIEKKKKSGIQPVLYKIITDLGAEYRINPEFPIIEELVNQLDHTSKKLINGFIKAINSELRQIVGHDEGLNIKEIGEAVDDEVTNDIRSDFSYYNKKSYSRDKILNLLYCLYQKELVDSILKNN